MVQRLLITVFTTRVHTTTIQKNNLLQIARTWIRLLLKEWPDLGLCCLPSSLIVYRKAQVAAGLSLLILGVQHTLLVGKSIVY